MRIGIIGGGIAGLSAAWYAADAGAEAVVFEGTADLGGKLKGVTCGPATIDVGAEAVLARRPEALDLIEAVGLSDKVSQPNPEGAQLWNNGALHPMPRSVMGVPGSPDALEQIGMAGHTITSRPVTAGSDDLSVGQFVEAGLGREVVDRLVEPLLGGVYAGHADQLSLRATTPFVAALAPDLLGSAAARLDNPAPGPALVNLAGGMWQLPQALAASGRFDVRISSTVRMIEQNDSRWQVTVSHPHGVSTEVFDSVIVAAPAPSAARLLAPLLPEDSFWLAGIELASVAVVAWAVRGASLPSGTGFLVPPVEGRFVKASTFSSQKWSWLADMCGDVNIVRASVGRAGDASSLQIDDDELAARAYADLSDMIGPEHHLGEVVETVVQRWGGALPQYAVGHLDRVAALRKRLGSIGGLDVCGAAYDGVGIAAVVASARAAVRRTTDGGE